MSNDISNNLYPNSPFIIDKVYSNLTAAQAGAADDGILLGRYILIKYCETAFGQDDRDRIESYNYNNADEYKGISNLDVKNYYKNYALDNRYKDSDGNWIIYTPKSERESYDRTLWRKVYGEKDEDNKYYYEFIANLKVDFSEEQVYGVLELRYEDNEIKLIRTDNGEEISSIDATNFIKDGMIETVVKEGNIIKITWNTDSGKEQITISLEDFIDVYNAGDGLKVNNKTFSVKIPKGENFLYVDNNGLKTQGIQEAIDEVKDASKIILNKNITLAGNFETIGNYKKGATIASGTSLEEILQNMLQQELEPKVTYPSASISVSGGIGEVGSPYTLPTAILKIDSVGSYEYGPDTKITFEIGKVKLTQGSNNSVTNTSAMVANSTIELQATDTATLYTDDTKAYKFTATAHHTNGEVPKTNLGNAYPSKQITAGSITITDKTVNFTGYRRAFAGGTTVETINSEIVRSMTATKNYKTSMDTQAEALEFTAAKGDTRIFFAYPKNASWSGTPNFEIFGLAWGATDGFVKKDNIEVADARGGDNGLCEYNLYVWEPSGGPLTADETKFRVWFS